MGKALRYLTGVFLFLLIQLSPQPVFACVQGLAWGMGLSSVENHLGVSLKPVSNTNTNSLYEIKDFQQKLEQIEKKQQFLEKIQDLERQKAAHDGKIPRS